MAVKLRLRRIGKKKKPHYRIVAIDSRVSRDGKYIDKLGNYNPLENPPEISVDEQKVLLWLNRGAIPTDTVRSLFRRVGIMMKWHLMKKGYSAEKIEEEFKKWELLRSEKEKREEALKVQKLREQKEVKSVEQKEASEEVKPVVAEEVDEVEIESSSADNDTVTEEPEIVAPAAEDAQNNEGAEDDEKSAD
ncbi:30S ribosomal protein S16 [candidate division KSB1 bacterium]|nr:30S ribosomal protein S16 [candidate division KSB1 bacterium]